MVHKSIFQLLEEINQWVKNPNPDLLKTFFQLEFGFLIWKKNHLIDSRNPSVVYQIEFLDQPRRVSIFPIKEETKPFFHLSMTTQYGGVWLYVASFYPSFLRTDDMVLADTEIGRLNTRFYDATASCYIKEENQKRNNPKVVYTHNLIPDLEFDSDPKRNHFKWNYKGMFEKEIKGEYRWYENHFLAILENIPILMNQEETKKMTKTLKK